MTDQKIQYRVLNSEGLEVDSIQLKPEVFGLDADPALVHRVVTWQLAKRRAGSHSTLTRAEVSGGGKKPWKQKGRGTARSGSNTSPVWVGGGRAHGPKPRSYEGRLNKEIKRKALASVLSDKVRTGQLLVISSIDMSAGKTKEFVQLLKNVRKEDALVDGGALVLMRDKQELVWRSVSNLGKVDALPLDGINVYDLLKRTMLVTTPETIAALEVRLSPSEA